tara:strand:+ start:482 stop:706 length:225 start_codon:yes stop_codon:yes gene_type:complete
MKKSKSLNKKNLRLDMIPSADEPQILTKNTKVKNLNMEDDQKFYIKTIKIYDQAMNKIDEILVEQIEYVTLKKF